MPLILGIDTSNYTTSVALLDTETKQILRQEKQLLPVATGAAGLRQSDAVFHHTRQLSPLLQRLSISSSPEDLCAIGVSDRPRPVEGSYMPCFLVGKGTAESIAAVTGIPVYATSHQMGHILAALYSADQLDLVHTPFVAFHVSGGTTDLIYCRPDENTVLELVPCGSSLDLKAGQAIDRVGLQLGLKFPCGPALEQLAAQSESKAYMKPTLRGMDCCLSGLENACQRRLQDGMSQEDVAAYCLNSVGQTLAAMTRAARQVYGDLPVLYAGGVMSNHLIRPILEEATPNCLWAEPEYASDNAAGVAIYALLQQAT